MNKKKINVFNKDAYLLGCDKQGINYYLESAKFDCGWYWGLGYVVTYSNNSNPERSRDINSHSHFDSMFLNGKNCINSFNELFVKSPFNDNEKYKLWEIMKSLYTLREYSDMLDIGGSHITTNPQKELIKNDAEYNRINKVVIPELLKSLYELLENEVA